MHLQAVLETLAPGASQGPRMQTRMPATLTAKQMWMMAAASCDAATEVFEDGECTCRPGFGDFGSGCVAEVPGCTNPDAGNFNSQANVDDGSCMCSCSCSLF